MEFVSRSRRLAQQEPEFMKDVDSSDDTSYLAILQYWYRADIESNHFVNGLYDMVVGLEYRLNRTHYLSYGRFSLFTNSLDYVIPRQLCQIWIDRHIK